MTATPKIWKSLTQVNATDSSPDGVSQGDGQIVALKDGDRRHPDGLHPGGFRSAQRARDVLSEASYASDISAAHSS
jgi:hypothetical protein